MRLKVLEHTPTSGEEPGRIVHKGTEGRLEGSKGKRDLETAKRSACDSGSGVEQ
jgi:hypothetical protein